MKTILSISLFLCLLVPCFGADKAIHQLTTGSPAVGTDYVPIDRQSGPNWNNFKLTVYDIQAANSNYIHAVSNYFSTVVVSNSSGVVSYNGRTGIVTMVSQDVFDANGLTNNQTQDVALFGNLSTFSGWNSNSLLPGHITISRSAGPALVLRQSGQVLGSIPAATNTLELSSAGVFFDPGTFLGSSLKAGTVVASAINPPDWLLATQQYSGWTNNGTYIWPIGQPAPTTNAPGPSMFIRKDGSMFFGTNVFQDTDIEDYNYWKLWRMSMIDSNEPSLGRVWLGSADSENYNNWAAWDFTWSGDPAIATAWSKFSAKNAINQGGEIEEKIDSSGPTFTIKDWTNNLFKVDTDGNLRTLRKINYYWPLAHGTGALTNDGSGNLGWSAFPTNYWGWNPNSGSITNATAFTNSLRSVVVGGLPPAGRGNFTYHDDSSVLIGGYDNLSSESGFGTIIGSQSVIISNGNYAGVYSSYDVRLGYNTTVDTAFVAGATTVTDFGTPATYIIAADRGGISRNTIVDNNAGYGGILGAKGCSVEAGKDSDFFLVTGNNNNVLATNKNSGHYYIFGGADNLITAPNTWIIGSGLTNSTRDSIQIGVDASPSGTWSTTNIPTSGYILVTPTNLALRGPLTLLYTNGTGVDYVLKDASGNGIFTPSAPVIGYQTNAWSGPTNDVNIGGLYDLNYAATTSVAITGFTNKPGARTAEVMLSIYNNAATNITMTLPAGVADGDYTLSHTITNGTVGYFWLRYTPQGPRTNSVFRQM